MEGKFYIAAIIDRAPCSLIDRPETEHYQFATLGALRRLKEDEASMVTYASEEKAKAHLEEIAADAEAKQWKVFLVPALDESNPGLALGFRVRCFLDALDEFNQFEGADEDDPEYKSAKEDLANARKDLEEMDVAVSIHNALNSPALALVEPMGDLLVDVQAVLAANGRSDEFLVLGEGYKNLNPILSPVPFGPGPAAKA